MDDRGDDSPAGGLYCARSAATTIPCGAAWLTDVSDSISGTFDPITNGHIDVIGRAAKLLDKLVVGVAVNAGKGPMFPFEERIEMVRSEVADLGNHAARIEVRGFDDLLVHFARDCKATVLVRGPAGGVGFRLRIPDGEHERQARARGRNRLPDGLGQVPVHRLAAGEGDRAARRRRVAVRVAADHRGVEGARRRTARLIKISR